MAAWYNENDPYAAQWLRNLVAAGHLPAGTVDDRSILDVEPADLDGYDECHFFAGIGGWPLALQLVGWPADRPVWSGSCPCQPFSSAGKRQGADDARHLWPAWFRLIRECRPAVIFGEQVASSLVIGPADEQDEDVQGLLDREAVLGILYELQRDDPQGLQGLRQGSRAVAQEARSRTHLAPAQKMATQFPGPCACQCCQEPGENQGIAVRPESDGHPKADRCRALRIDGHRFQPGRTESLECAIARPADTGSRLYPRECQSGSLCAERDGERLGREAHRRDCQCDHCEAHREVERLVARNSGAAEAEITWLAGIRGDLERIGYTFGACVAPACGAGAPHIRQRLFWVASRGMAHSGRIDLAAGTVEGRAALVEAIQSSPEHRGAGGLADADEAGSGRLGRGRLSGNGHAPHRDDADRCGTAGGLALPTIEGRGEQPGRDAGTHRRPETQSRRLLHAGGLADARHNGHDRADEPMAGPGPGDRPDRQAVGQSEGSHWDSAVWLPCLDGKARRAEPGVFPLVAGLPAAMDGLGPISRVGALRGAGNSIVPQAAAAFVAAVMEARR